MVQYKGAVVAVLVLVTMCRAEDPGVKATQDLLTQTIDRGIEILNDAALDDAARLAKFDVLLAKSCHLDLMAKLALGKTGWKAFSEVERNEYIIRFRDLIKRSYYGKFAQHDASSFEAEYLTNEALSKTKRSLKAVMKTSTSNIEVIYKFYFKNEAWRIYDVEVEGVSLVASYRAQFDDFLAQHRPGELLEELKKAESSFVPIEERAPGKGN